jgi:hypothetical protein
MDVIVIIAEWVIWTTFDLASEWGFLMTALLVGAVALKLQLDRESSCH